MKENIEFIHLRRFNMGRIEPLGGTTVAFVTDQTGTRFATARCSDKDNFVKATGRTMAAGRLESMRFQKQSPITSGDEFRNAVLTGAIKL